MLSLVNNNNLKNNFDKNGFVIVKNFFNYNELNEFKESLLYVIKNTLDKASKQYDFINPQEFDGIEFDDGIIKLEQTDTNFIADIYDVIPQLPSFMRLTAKREFSKIVNDIFEKEENNPLFTFTNRCRIDPPRITRRSTSWHQEVFYTIPKSEFVQTWCPLIMDITKETGGIEVCIGSHKEGIAKQTCDNSKGAPTPFVVDNQIVDTYKKTIVELRLGDVMIFSPKLFHRSGSNISNHVRYTGIGMFHNIDNPTFRPPQPSFVYKNMDPIDYYNEVFKKN